MDLSKTDIEFFKKKLEVYLSNESNKDTRNDMILICEELIEGYHKLPEN